MKRSRCCAGDQSFENESLKDNRSVNRTDPKSRPLYVESKASDSDSESADGSLNGRGQPHKSDPKMALINDPAFEETVNAFKAAIKQGNSSLARYYFNENPTLQLGKVTWPNGDTCLQVAVRVRSQNLLRMLLKEGIAHGININDQNAMTGDTCLHTAVRAHQDFEIVQLLIDYEIDANIMNHEFATAVRIAEELRNVAIIKFLSKYSIHLQAAKRDESMEESSSTPLHAMDDDAIDHYAQEILRNSHDGQEHTRNATLSESDPNLPSSLWGYQTASEYFSETEYANLTMEAKMDDVEPGATTTLAKVNLKNTNPFSKVRVTKHDDSSVRQLMRDVEMLPELDGYLLKQTSKPPYTYQKRWVHVTEEWLLWNDRMIDVNFNVDTGPTMEERKRFGGAVHLKNVMLVERTGKSGKKFMMKVRFKTGSKLHYRKIVWKCNEEEDRDYWCDGLAQYVAFCKEVRRLYKK